MTRGRDDERVPMGGVVAAGTVLVLALVVGAAWVALFVYAGDRAPRDARVEGVDISRLDPAAAEARLRAALADRARQPVTVSYGDGRTRSVDPAAAGLDVDYAASVEAAGGGSGWSFHRLWQVATGGGNHRAVVTVDEQKMATTLDALAQGIGNPPVDGTVTFTDGRAVGVPGHPGQVIDRSAARALLVQRYLQQGSQKLPTRTEPPAVTPDEVNRVLGAFGRPATSAPVTVVLAGQRVVAPPRLFGRALSMRVDGERLVPQVDADVLLRTLAPLTPSAGAEPVDARVVLREGRPVVVPARVGVSPDADRLEAAFTAALTRHGAARQVVVPGEVRQPAFTTAEARALRVAQRVGTATVRFPWSDRRNTRLARSAALVDGTLLRPGDTFSLSSALGLADAGSDDRPDDRTEQSAVSGPQGDDDPDDTSALASGLFRAMFLAGLEDVAHTPPSTHAPAAAVGLEATLVWPSADLRFRDDSPYGVLVSADVRKATPRRPGELTVTMWSTKRWDVTVRTGPRTAVVAPAVRYVQTRSCRPVTGSPGFGVDVQRVLRRPGSPAVVRTQTFHTDYRATDTVRCTRGRTPRQG